MGGLFCAKLLSVFVLRRNSHESNGSKPWPYLSRNKSGKCLKFSNWLFFTVAEENLPKQIDDLGSQFTEIFIKQQDNVTLVLSLVEVSSRTLLGMLRDLCWGGR